MLISVDVVLQNMARKSEENQNELGDLMTVSEAAKVRGVTRQAIHALIERGRLRSVNMFGRVLLYRSELEAFEKEAPGPKKSEN
jgi:excisionase family DNA binding protein